MPKAEAMRIIDSLRRGLKDGQTRLQGHRTQQPIEWVAFYVSHSIISFISFYKANIIHWDDIWILQTGCNYCLSDELVDVGGARDKSIEHYLQGDESARQSLLDKEYFPHTTAIQQADRTILVLELVGRP